jgi:hypothetical protein
MIQGNDVSLLSAWQTEYVILGTAAATLTGLMFIVITLMAGARIRRSSAYLGVSSFTEPTLVHFTTVLMIALIINAPWQELTTVGIVIGVAGLVGLIYILRSVPQMRHLPDYQPKTNDWVWYFTAPLILYIALIAAAWVLPRSPAPALYAIAAISVGFLLVGLRNAWDLVIYLAIDLSHPNEGDQN